MNCIINIVLVFHCSNFLSDDCLKVVYCSVVFVICTDLHVYVLLHTFVLPLRLELKFKAQDLTQGKRSRFFMKISEIHVLFLWKNQRNSGEKKNQKFCLNPALLLKLLSRKILVYKQKRQWKLLKSELLFRKIANFTGKLLQK